MSYYAASSSTDAGGICYDVAYPATEMSYDAAFSSIDAAVICYDAAYSCN